MNVAAKNLVLAGVKSIYVWNLKKICLVVRVDAVVEIKVRLRGRKKKLNYF